MQKQPLREEAEGNEKEKVLLQLSGRSSAWMTSESHLIRTNPCRALCEQTLANDENTAHTL